MSYALQTLWHEKSRYFPGVLAVAFSAVLMALQFGLMLGLFMITSIPIDHTDPQNVWVGSNDVKSVDLGQPIPESTIGRIPTRPGVRPPEVYGQVSVMLVPVSGPVAQAVSVTAQVMVPGWSLVAVKVTGSPVSALARSAVTVTTGAAGSAATVSRNLESATFQCVSR